MEGRRWKVEGGRLKEGEKMASEARKRLGEILVERGLINLVQLDCALAQQRATREFLGTILVKQGLITGEALQRALSEQFGIPCESLSPERIDWALISPFPASLLGAGKCFPIRATAHCVTVAIINPLDVDTLSQFEKVAAGLRKVEPVLVSERDLQAVVFEYRRGCLREIEKRLSDSKG